MTTSTKRSTSQLRHMVTAVHEAGHAVAACCVGWPVKVVWIRGQVGNATTPAKRFQRTEARSVTVMLAGWRAERISAGQPDDRMSFYVRDMQCCIKEARRGQYRPVSDAKNALHKILTVRGRQINDDELASIFWRHEEAVARLMAHPLVWGAVLRIARALHRRRRLVAAEIEALLAEPGRRTLMRTGRRLSVRASL